MHYYKIIIIKRSRKKLSKTFRHRYYHIINNDVIDINGVFLEVNIKNCISLIYNVLFVDILKNKLIFIDFIAIIYQRRIFNQFFFFRKNIFLSD